MDLLNLLLQTVLISLASFGGGAQALFYQYTVIQTGILSNFDLSAILGVGYATPGPAVFGVATFAGYRLNGLWGAIIGTIGIFIVPFVGGLLASRYLQRFLTDGRARLFMRSVGLAIAGVIAATAFALFPDKPQLWQILVAAVAFYATIKYKLNPLLLITFGLVIGAVAALV